MESKEVDVIGSQEPHLIATGVRLNGLETMTIPLKFPTNRKGILLKKNQHCGTEYF